MGIVIRRGDPPPGHPAPPAVAGPPPAAPQALLERLARNMARLHTRTFLVDVWARCLDEDGQACPWYPTWAEWAQAAKDGRWPEVATKVPWEE